MHEYAPSAAGLAGAAAPAEPVAGDFPETAPRAHPEAPAPRAHPEGPDSPRRLRVGVFADSPLQPRWIVEAFARVAASNIAVVVAIAEGRSTPRALSWPWRLYDRLDNWLFSSAPDPSERVALRAGVAHPDVAHPEALTLPETGAGAEARAQWRERILALDLDVAFAAGEVDGALLEGVARCGVWRYCFGEDHGTLDALAGVREVAGGDMVTCSALRVSRGGETMDRLVYRSWSRTYPFSISRNRANLLRKTSRFAYRALRELHRSESEWLKRWPSLPAVASTPVPAMPRGGETVRGLVSLAGRAAQRCLEKLFYVDQWFLAYRFGTDGGWPTELRNYHCLVPPRDRIWADPFPIERDGRHFIFFEEVMLAAGKGRIAMVEVDREGNCSRPVGVLERDYHISYPYLIEHGGELYMVPETGDNRTVEIYRCTDFPTGWQLEKVLLRDAWYTDATIHRNGDTWWMFVNIGVEGTEAHDELHLYYADHLLGEWQPHRGNPVKSDVRGARPAGRLYRCNDVLYRPSQICAPLYGSGVSINRVLHVSPHAFVELEDERLLPHPQDGLLGMHTINRAGELSVVDAFMRRRRLGASVHALRLAYANLGLGALIA